MNRPELAIAPDIQIEPLKALEADELLPILREHVRDPDTGEVLESEVQEIQGYMQGKEDKHGRVRKYLVARGDDGKVYGCMAYASPPDPDLIDRFKWNVQRDPMYSAQLLDVFFSDREVGEKLLNRICRRAEKEGKLQLWVAGDARHRDYEVFYEINFGRPPVGSIYRREGLTNTWYKMLDHGPYQISTAGSDYYKYMSAQEYRRKINTPARNPEYFRQFHQPIIERAKQQFGVPIRLLDIACGPGDELDFVKNDPEVQIIATDASQAILPSVRDKLGGKAGVFAGDVRASALQDNIADAGILVNAMVYVPDKMLETMYRALKPGGECAVNFRIFGNEHNKAFYDFNLKRGGKILNKKLAVETPEGPKDFDVKVLDYTEFVNDDGTPDLSMRQLVQQIYFQSVDDVKDLISAIGFEQVEHSQFEFASPANPNNQIDVFILKKPLSKTDS